MAGPLLIIAIGAMMLVVFWYVLDEATRGGEGKSGFLGMQEPGDSAPKGPDQSGWKRGGNRPWRVHRH